MPGSQMAGFLDLKFDSWITFKGQMLWSWNFDNNFYLIWWSFFKVTSGIKMSGSQMAGFWDLNFDS